MIGIAVKVTLDPWQTGFSEAVTVRLTGKLLLTIIVIACEFAGLPVAQVAFEVRMQVTTSLFDGV